MPGVGVAVHPRQLGGGALDDAGQRRERVLVAGELVALARARAGPGGTPGWRRGPVGGGGRSWTERTTVGRPDASRPAVRQSCRAPAPRAPRARARRHRRGPLRDQRRGHPDPDGGGSAHRDVHDASASRSRSSSFFADRASRSTAPRCAGRADATCCSWSRSASSASRSSSGPTTSRSSGCRSASPCCWSTSRPCWSCCGCGSSGASRCTRGCGRRSPWRCVGLAIVGRVWDGLSLDGLGVAHGAGGGGLLRGLLPARRGADRLGGRAADRAAHRRVVVRRRRHRHERPRRLGGHRARSRTTRRCSAGSTELTVPAWAAMVSVVRARHRPAVLPLPRSPARPVELEGVGHRDARAGRRGDRGLAVVLRVARRRCRSSGASPCSRGIVLAQTARHVPADELPPAL